MNITTVGPAGYSYQDYVTAWLVLAWRTASPLSAIAEAGQEDATFTLTADAATQVFEVQMKSQNKPIDESLLGLWLAHFPERKSTHSLLEQLEVRPDLRVLFVTSAACTDVVAALSVLRPDEALRPRVKPDCPLLLKHAEQVLQAYSRAHFHEDPKPLSAQRDAHCKSVASRMGGSAFREIARRIYILSHIDQDTVRDRGCRILNQEFFVPQNQADRVLDDLAKLVRDAVGTTQDIASPIIEAANRRGQSLLLSNRPHIQRSEEHALFNELEQRHVVLLTGSMHAGKTQTARALTRRYQQRGYYAAEESDLGTARRFLQASGSEERILILEDPFGAQILNPNAHQSLNSLRDLLADVSEHRKMIVTSRAYILGELLGTLPWLIDGIPFQDLSVTDDAVVASIWATHALANGVSKDITDRIRSLLHKQHPDELLQPGQLRHLARNIQGNTEDEWLRVARQDGRDLGRALAENPTLKDILAALRILASTTLSASSRELFFVLSKSHARPGMDQGSGPALTLSDDTITAPVFPEYTTQHQATRIECDALDAMERRGFIELISDEYRFSHPTYVEAAEQALRTAQGNSFQRFVEMCARALFCLNPINAAHATSAMTILRDVARTNDERKQVAGLAFAAFQNSIFPVVRDRCLLWLLSSRTLLDQTQNERILHAVRHGGAREEHVVWRHGEAWLDQRTIISVDDSFSAKGMLYPRDTAPDEALKAWGASQTGVRLLPEFLWSLLYCQPPEIVPLGVLQRAFSYHESFVRALAAKIALGIYPQRDDLAQLVVSDEHPRVFAAGLAGLLSKWGDQGAIRGARLREFIAATITPERATAMLGLLVQFESVGRWYSGQEMPAETWALLAARVLPNVSSADRVDTMHLLYYAERLLPQVSVALAIKVLQEWLTWALRAVQNSAPENVYGFGRLWMSLTGSDASLRPNVIERLLGCVDTNFFVSAIVALVDDWDKLDDSERRLVLEALGPAQADARWARAVLLACRNPPDEVLARLLGSSASLRSLHIRRLEPIDRRIIKDFVRVCEQEGARLNFNTSNSAWALIVRLSADTRDQLFERALRLCLSEYGGGLGADRWARHVWLSLCCGADAHLRSILFEQLLERTVTTVASHFGVLWEVLLATTMSEWTLKQWVERLDDFIEALDENGDVDIFIRNDRIGPSVRSRLPRDLLWRLHYDGVKTDEEWRKLANLVYSGGAPRLQRTHESVLRVLGVERRWNSDDDGDSLVERIISARLASISVGSSRRDELYDDGNRRVDDWTSLREQTKG